MAVKRISAFSLNGTGGNPAGVCIVDEFPASATMLSIAKEIGYSETAFVHPMSGDRQWRVRYFSPEQEVPFCGHATIALTTELGRLHGPGSYELFLNNASISVTSECDSEGLWKAGLISPQTHSGPAQLELINKALSTFNFSANDLNPQFQPTVASAGATHLLLSLKNRETLSQMHYDYDRLREIMLNYNLTTVNLFYVQDETTIYCRNPFAAGGVYEDPATGAAAAALCGYLREIGWIPAGSLAIYQGAEMGKPSKISAEIRLEPGSGIHISGETVPMTKQG